MRDGPETLVAPAPTAASTMPPAFAIESFVTEIVSEAM